jgi:hypothetical protein
MRSITKDDIDGARTPWVWDLGNSILYDLCRNHPGHKTNHEIIAKVWLIGRSYAASIERRRNAERFGDSFYEEIVAPGMMESHIDEWLAGFSKDKSPGTTQSIAVHKHLMDLFKSFTDLEKRSLASKYLHFHEPKVFFIYDSRARQAITKVVPRLNRLPDISPASYDKEYKDFVRRCVWLRNDIFARHRVFLTPREIDKLLLVISEEKRAN